MSFEPTPEQASILDALKNSTDNLLITALAGAAKTTTLVMLAQALAPVPTLALAFNKRIATELQQRLPSTAKAQTLNSLGHQAWGRQLGKFLKLDADKVYRLLKAEVDGLPADERGAAYELFTDIKDVINSGKAGGYIPTGAFERMAKPLLNDEEFFATLDEELPQWALALIKKVSLLSLREAMQGTVDFGDQLLMPACFSVSFPQYPAVLVDEAQDLSELNHVLLQKLVRKRLIAVGDPNQAIYAFRGAAEDSMELLRERFSMREMVLTVSFRCPIEIVKAARWRAPMMRWPDWAKPGTVQHISHWTADILPDNAVILCRNNAPLYNMAFRLLKAGRYPELVGNEIGKSLLKTLKKFGKPALSQEEVLVKIGEWQEEKQRKARSDSARARVSDQAACLRIFAERGATLGDALAYAEHIFTISGPIKLMTGHKSKGLEFEDVYILDQHLLGKEGQERNLRYVMITRSKNTLTYIRSEDYEDGE